MPYLLRGALIEYASDFLGPLPNVVLFQFNPESLSRTIQIPARPSGASSRESSQAGELPTETISLTAYFSAADYLNGQEGVAQAFGIGPQLAALEKMAQPQSLLTDLTRQALDAVAGALAEGSEPPTQTIPRQRYPKLLFIWGATRVLPVKIDSLRIVEQHFDNLLNPIQAEVALEIAVMHPDACMPDPVAQGAFAFSSLAKDAQATVNLAGVVKQALELIPF